MRASESPVSTIPSFLMVMPYRPDTVLYNEMSNSVTLLELTCPLDSFQHPESARDQKQSKEEYLQILSELDCIGVSSQYDTIEVSYNVLGHYFPSSLKTLFCIGNIFNQSEISRKCSRNFSILASRKILLARDCPELTHN